MAHAYSNKKKVRGWKRQIRRVEQFTARYRELDIAAVRQHQRGYVKLWIDPWYRLIKRNPPFWLRRLMLGALIEIYNSWQKKLIALGQPYYLALWLFDPRFYKSQVVVSIGECLDYYDKTFNSMVPPGTLPEPYTSEKYDLSEFEWEPCLDEERFMQEDFDLEDPSQRAWIAKHPYRIENVEINRESVSLLVFRSGSVWVGKKRL